MTPIEIYKKDANSPLIRIVGSNFPKWAREHFAHVVPDNDEPVLKDLSLENPSWKVYYFYPKDFDEMSATEIAEFDSLVEEFDKLNCKLFGVSPDSELAKLAWKKQNTTIAGIKHTLISDTGNALGSDLGIITAGGSPIRATYILNEYDSIRHVSFSSVQVIRSASETLRVLKETQKAEMVQ